MNRGKKAMKRKGEGEAEEEDEENPSSQEDSLPEDDDRKTKGKKARKTIPKEKKKEKNEELQRDKDRLAEVIQQEEVIHNLNHPMHSIANAVAAAWQRVAKKTNKPGDYFIDFIVWKNIVSVSIIIKS